MKHIKITTSSTDDSIEVVKLQNETFEFTIDKPWEGDSNTGFGRSLEIALNKDQAIQLRDALNQMLK
jgi:hypothetical protein